MNIISIDDRRIWDDFILANAPHTLFHSFEWGEIEKGNGRKVWRVGLLNSKSQAPNSKQILNTNIQIQNLLGISQIVKIEARRGTFLHVRHGPLLVKWDKKIVPQWLQWIIELAKKERAAFIRMSPLIDRSHSPMLQSLGFRDAPIQRMDFELVSMINLQLPEVELLKNMRKTTRNLIRKAERMGVAISDEAPIEEFMALHEKTFRRHGFIPNPNIAEEHREFSKSGASCVWTARYEEELLAAAVIITYGNQAMYRHGASVSSKIPAAYYLQWNIMQTARQRGIQWYNLGGITDSDNPNHPWYGLTLFKQGFGGETKDYLHTQDYPVTAGYWFTYAIETTRKIRRGY